MIARNCRGQLYQRGIHGYYPVNDGDPQNAIDEDELPTDEELDRAEMDSAENLLWDLSQMQQKE